jgi:hypothetical protein
MRRHTIFGSLVLLLSFDNGALAFNQTTAASDIPQYSVGPLTDHSVAVPGPNDVLRLRRGQRYNTLDSSGPELGEQSDDGEVGLSSPHSYLDPFPFGLSDNVVVGQVTTGQAYLSDDKRDIYSEFNVSVQEARTISSAERHIQSGDSVVVQRYGGAIRLPSGKVLFRALQDFSMPLVGKRYLLFLKYDPSTEDFHIVTGYQLDGQHTYNLDIHSRSDQIYTKLIHPLRDQGQNEQQLLDRVKAIAPPNWEK